MTTNQKTILVVEDSPVQALALVRMLEMQNIHVLCAANGESGLEMAQQTMPNGIVLDIQMPGIDGLEVCRRLQNDKHTAHIPIILLTSHANPDTVLHGFNNGAVDFIPKDAFYEAILIETLKHLNIIEAPAAE